MFRIQYKATKETSAWHDWLVDHEATNAAACVVAARGIVTEHRRRVPEIRSQVVLGSDRRVIVWDSEENE